ncbi:MAG TPA: class I SAM-dependent methyltransferase [Baekduia sp.]|nr:class I SAM-dependent methyltransferase [Baekduia sp.]
MPSPQSLTPTSPTTGSAHRWGPLWGHRPDDWAATEDQQRPTYEEALRRLDVGPGQHVLDVGCGSGVFLELAARRDAVVHGIDASISLLDRARARVPDADLRQADMEDLPYADNMFDVVCGFNAFFFAQDMVAALREAGRVARPGAPVLVQVFGAPEDCDLEAAKAVLRPFLPAPPPGAPAAPALWRPGALEEIARAAGLTPTTAFDFNYAMDYPDAETLGRRLVATAGVAKLVGPEREPAIRAALVAALEPQRRADGTYHLNNAFHYIIAEAA